MKTKPKFKKKDKVYFINDYYIDYGIVNRIIPRKPEKKILRYDYEIYYYTDESIERIYKNFGSIILPEAILYLDKKELIKNLSKNSKDCEIYLNNELKRKK